MVTLKNDKKTIFGWCMYDWANSAFATSITTAILPAYFGALFIASRGSAGWKGWSGESLWAFSVSFATGIVALSSPPLGVIADHLSLKMKFLKIYAFAGSLCTILLFTAVWLPGYDWMWLLGFYMLANIGFAGGNVFYNSLLTSIVDEDQYDDVSSKGFAYGYIGGGLLLLIHLIVITTSDSNPLVIRLSLASVGIWWFGWGLVTFTMVPEPNLINPASKLSTRSTIKMAFGELWQTAQDIQKFKVLFTYLLAFLLFNDGIQTVLSVAGVYAAITLGVSLTFQMGTILILQFVGAPGAIVFSKIAKKIGTKSALSITLFIWMLVVLLAIGMSALEPVDPAEHDYRLEWRETSYAIVKVPSLKNEGSDADWQEKAGKWNADDTLTIGQAQLLKESTAQSRFSIHIMGGELAESTIGSGHPSQIGDGWIDFIPTTLRTYVWKPLRVPLWIGTNGRFSSSLQFLLLGIFVGFVMGGSQALARSLFATIMPETRSGEFFGFFGFIGKAASVIGPLLFGFTARIFDRRVGILAILAIILVGTLVLKFVDVNEGRRVASEEDEQRRGGLTAS